jgi:hypothetical protein
MHALMQSGTYDAMRQELDAAGRAIPWQERNRTLLWRGSTMQTMFNQTETRRGILRVLGGDEFTRYFEVRCCGARSALPCRCAWCRAPLCAQAVHCVRRLPAQRQWFLTADSRFAHLHNFRVLRSDVLPACCSSRQLGFAGARRDAGR